MSNKERVLSWLSSKNPRIRFRPSALMNDLDIPKWEIKEILLDLVKEGRLFVEWEIECGVCLHAIDMIKTTGESPSVERIYQVLWDVQCDRCGSEVLDDYDISPIFGFLSGNDQTQR